MRSLACAAASLVLAAAHVAGQPPARPAIVITGVTVYVSPYEPALPHATVVITDSTITAVGPTLDVATPPGATVLACNGCAVMAGFWNAHVHLVTPMFAADQPADTLAAHFQAMLTRWGFTTVVDLGSDPHNTVPLRRRVLSGEIAGPRIFTAGTPLYPPHGIPFYLVNSLPPDVVAYMDANATPATRAAARAQVDADVQAGADLTKLFTGSWIAHGTVLPMPDSIASAAVREAHRLHRIVFSHCSNMAGARVALDAGVDVMAHALDDTRGVDSAFFRRMVEHQMAMVPTLSLFADGKNIDTIVHEVTIFRAYGGDLLFGTDVGFTHEFDTTREYRLLAQAGLTTEDVLRMLTTAPSVRFGFNPERHAMVRVGLPADLTVLAADPRRAGLETFAHVKYTIRRGRVIFAAP
jgi:imidazolonepropionase-like amidohydrolase